MKAWRSDWDMLSARWRELSKETGPLCYVKAEPGVKGHQPKVDAGDSMKSAVCSQPG